MKNKGFSLVELIVVIAIMAILVGVAVPVYSSYIEKANKAKDEQLLGEINSAFAVALAGNAIDINTVTEADIPVNDGVVNLAGMTVNGAENTAIENAMIGILGSDLEFAVIEEIFYNENTHKFVANEDVVFNFNGKDITISSKDLAILSGDNSFSALGSEALLGEVGTLEKLIGIGAGEDILNEIGASEAFVNAFAGYLGLKMEDYETEDEYWQAYEDKMAELETKNPNAVTNAMVMYAASSTAHASDEVINGLFAYNENQALTSRIEGATEAETMTNAALSYGMYVAYAQRNNIDTTDVANFSQTVNTKEFADYCASADGQADLEAYRAAMNMIGDNTDNPEITSSILENGISGNDDLETLMKDVMGN